VATRSVDRDTKEPPARSAASLHGHDKATASRRSKTAVAVPLAGVTVLGAVDDPTGPVRVHVGTPASRQNPLRWSLHSTSPPLQRCARRRRSRGHPLGVEVLGELADARRVASDRGRCLVVSAKGEFPVAAQLGHDGQGRIGSRSGRIHHRSKSGLEALCRLPDPAGIAPIPCAVGDLPLIAVAVQHPIGVVYWRGCAVLSRERAGPGRAYVRDISGRSGDVGGLLAGSGSRPAGSRRPRTQLRPGVGMGAICHPGRVGSDRSLLEDSVPKGSQGGELCGRQSPGEVLAHYFVVSWARFA
jgi:hypothetical protein